MHDENDGSPLLSICWKLIGFDRQIQPLLPCKVGVLLHARLVLLSTICQKILNLPPVQRPARVCGYGQSGPRSTPSWKKLTGKPLGDKEPPRIPVDGGAVSALESGRLRERHIVRSKVLAIKMYYTKYSYRVHILVLLQRTDLLATSLFDH